MGEETRKSPRGRKPNTPSLDAIRKAIERGEYDDNLNDITGSVARRRGLLQKDLMDRVREVFGPEAEIHLPKGDHPHTHPKVVEAKNPFVKKAHEQELPEIDQGDHEFRIDPRDGNAYRIDDREPPETPIAGSTTSSSHLWICDVLGGHRQTILKSAWESWTISKPATDKSGDDEVMPELDEMEQKMERENAAGEAGTTTVEAPVDIERRGASISGMHSSDMGGA